jgi:hypothetical protein
MKFPKREDFIESIEYNGEIYTSVNEDAWLYALKQYNRKKNRLESFRKKRKETPQLKNIIKLVI